MDQLHAEVTGSGPPLLMLHGWGSSAELMRGAAAGLAGRFRVHNLDLPGHGRTPPPPAAWGVPEYATLVADYLDAHALGPVPVIGHSNGGRIALFMASDPLHAARFERLVLVAPSGVEPRRSASYHAKTAWIRAIKAPFALLPEPYRTRGLAWLRTTIYWKLAASSDYQRASGVMRDTFVRTVTHHLPPERLARIAQPTLLLWGDRDDAVQRYQMDVLARSIPNATLRVLEGAGHYAYLDAPAAYAEAVDAFLVAPPAAG